MNAHTLRVLEFEKVRNIVASHAASEPGRREAARLVPAVDAETVQVRLRETDEYTKILLNGENPPLDGILDITQALEKLSIVGSALSPGELLHTATTLGAGRRVKSFFDRLESRTGAGPRAPLLCAIAARIVPLKHIEEAVVSAIDDKAEVKDSASPELRKVRKQLARTREDILNRMSSILQDSGFQKVIQEPVVTVRDDRYVLPLKPGFRQSLQGVVHGQSGSRATLFVEPLAVLEQNNRLAELRLEEREEVERILRELTALVAREYSKIEETVRALTSIDAVYARARFGIEYGGSVSELSPDRSIRLRAARHPLLVGKSKAALHGSGVTPNDITLEGEQRTLILSGPNAGGKTVVLKTVGLLCLMAQAGLPITAGEGSEVSCFGSIFADIGDEQSLEQDLSTFSSHVSQIAEILRQADEHSLVLLDELGSGTDPAEGAGLGAAVLESLIERGCCTIVTTHQNALKLFGAETSGAVNAAMEFDPLTLKPTYRLIPGRPGRSYGLDMAARLGIPDGVIQKARSRIGEDDLSLDRLLKQVEENGRAVAEERRALEKELTTARQERAETAHELNAAREEARTLRARAKADARDVLSELRRKLREFSRLSRLEQAEAKQAGVEVEALARRLEPAGADIEPTVPVFTGEHHAGDRVRIARLNKTGTVLTAGRGIVEIEVAGKTLKLSASDVAPLGAEGTSRQTITAPGWSAEIGDDEGATDRLNLIGLRVEAGLAELDRFIDRAGAHNLSVLTVIHGLGTGALKTAVTEFLKNHPLVSSIRPGEPAEGGAGVTVAELKK